MSDRCLGCHSGRVNYDRPLETIRDEAYGEYI